ncbi:MAG: ABC transporter permease [Chitinophagaceae bacterium]
MIKNYLKTAWRNISRNKAFSFINILGLTAGTVCCLYILLYVRDQYGYDTYHDNAQSIYRIRTVIDAKRAGDVEFNSATASPPIAMGMKEDFPEVVLATRIISVPDASNNLLSAAGSSETFYESNGYVVDSTFFQMFDYKFIEGKPFHSLDEPYTVVLSSAVAKKIFGKEPALGKQINVANKDGATLLKVTGVFDETYGKTHLDPHFIMTMNSGGVGDFVHNNQQWAGQNFVFSYVKLNPKADVAGLQAKLPAFLDKHGSENLRQLGMTGTKHLFLQKMTDIHLHSKGVANQISKVSDAQFLYLLLTIAFFIQLIACINFINLTTARSLRRAREIGVRKVVGAMKSSLIGQFLGESVLISFIAILLAVPILILLLPFLNNLTEGSITVSALFSPVVVMIIVALGLVTGLLAGIYPAIYLSGFKPVSVLKGAFSFRSSSVVLRKSLVVFQIVIAIVLIISVIVISGQVRYMQNKDLGFDKQRLIIPLQSEQAQQQYAALRNDIMQMKEVSGTAGCKFYPSTFITNDFGLYTAGHDMTWAKGTKINSADEHFFDLMNIKVLLGRNLNPGDTSNQCVANETLLRQLDIPKETAVGTKVYNEYDNYKQEYVIVGVINDYNFNSLKEDVRPLVTFYSNKPAYLVVQGKTDNYASIIAGIGTDWKKLVPSTPFEYSFLDQDVAKQYQGEQTIRKISNSFTILAILISCLGLFGLAMFTAQQRIKEIGVRKVLGASVTGIVSMLSKDFVKLVLISLVIASPVAWWMMTKWLGDFAYRFPISWWIFALAGVIAMLIALATISFQAIKAAVANPVKSLRTE